MYLHLKQSPNTSDFEKVWKQCSKEFSLQDLAEADEVAQERTIYQHFLSTVLLHSAFIQVNIDQVFFPLFRSVNFSCQGIFSVKPRCVTAYGRPYRNMSLLHPKEYIAMWKHRTSLMRENIYILRPPSCASSRQKSFQYPVWHTLNLVPSQNDTIISLFSWAHT